MQIDRCSDFGRKTTVRIHIGRKKSNGAGCVFLQAANEMTKTLVFGAVLIGKNIQPRLRIHDALVNVHSAAGFMFHWLGHKRGVYVVAQSSLMYGALENEHLVREVQGITVQEIDFQLSDTGLMDQAVYVQVLGFTKIVHFFDYRIEFVDGVNAIGLPACFSAARPADRRFQFMIRVKIFLYQVELYFGRNHRPPAFSLVQRQDPPKHIARCKRMRFTLPGITVMNDLGGRVFHPGNQSHGVGVRAEHHVGVHRPHQFIVHNGVITRHRLHQDCLRKSGVFLDEFVRRDELPARPARHIRYQALHFGDPVFLKPVSYSVT